MTLTLGHRSRVHLRQDTKSYYIVSLKWGRETMFHGISGRSTDVSQGVVVWGSGLPLGVGLLF